MQIPHPTPSAVAAFEDLLPDAPKVTTRKVFGQPAAFVGGTMFFGVFGDHLFVRLSEEDRAEALKLPGTKVFEPMPGRPMREYVVLPEPLRADRRAARRWVDRSVTWASQLPAKGSSKRVGPAPKKRASGSSK